MISVRLRGRVVGPCGIATASGQRVDFGGRSTHGTLVSSIVGRGETNLRNLASIDSLSNLANRRRFDESFEHAMADSQIDSDLAPTLIVIDIDNFKNVNDSHGHHAGDVVIASLGAIIARSIRGQDLGARVGGDEFAVLLDHGDLDAARRVAARIQTGLDRFRWEWPIDVTVSIGIARMLPGEDGESLLLAADIALYSAKQNGPGQVLVREIYSKE
jgi:diguanylate cyclase (GGDEF)-like protein